MPHMENVRFGKHPSAEMVSLFKKKPYQGQSPDLASIIFLSSDANYSPSISEHEFFNSILEYQKDGVAFWEKYGCHHPFLMATYPYNKTEGGVPFHRTFKKLNLNAEHAKYVSFVELLDIPTIGNKSENRAEFFKLTSIAHLKYLDNLFNDGREKLFFVPAGVLMDLKIILRQHPELAGGGIETLCKRAGSKMVMVNKNEVHEIYHFSSSQIHGQLLSIRSKIDRWLERRKAL